MHDAAGAVTSDSAPLHMQQLRHGRACPGHPRLF